jgi:hypothetical protein
MTLRRAALRPGMAWRGQTSGSGIRARAGKNYFFFLAFFAFFAFFAFLAMVFPLGCEAPEGTSASDNQN